MSCLASVGFIQKHAAALPADTGSSYAREGTEAHLYASRLLSGEKRVPRPGSSEMVACIEEGYVPFIQAEAKRLGLKRIPQEITLPLFYDRSQRGTCDAPLLGDKAASIVDLKYGAGISVEARFNTQLAIYAESVIREKAKHYRPSTPLSLVIFQPRAQDNRIVRRWDLTRGELAEFCRDIQETAHAIIMDPDDQPFAPDAETTCRFCPAKAFCSAYAAHLLEELPPPVEKALATVEAKLHLPGPKELKDHQLIRLLRVRADVEDWFQEMEDFVVARMLKGSRYEGLKVVEGKSNRQWTDEAAAAKLLRKLFTVEDLFTEPEFKSPAAIGKLIAALRKKPDTAFSKAVAKLITKPDGKPKVASKEDPRPPLQVAVLDDLL